MPDIQRVRNQGRREASDEHHQEKDFVKGTRRHVREVKLWRTAHVLSSVNKNRRIPEPAFSRHDPAEKRWSGSDSGDGLPAAWLPVEPKKIGTYASTEHA